LSLRLFAEVIAQLEKYLQPSIDAQPADQPVSVDHVAIIVNYLEFRWQLIKNNDEQYLIHHTCPVNLLCDDLAFTLVKNKLAGGLNKHELLMPTVSKWFNPVSNHHLQDYYWHNMLLTDEASDGSHRVMELGYVNPGVNQKGELELTCELDGVAEVLSPDEKQRVHAHSGVIQRYQDFYVKKMTDSHRSLAKSKQEEKLEDDLHKAFRDPQYSNQVVGSTYGEAGLNLLKRNLLQNVKRLFISREQLFDYMSAKVAPEKWSDFLDPEKMNADMFFNLMVSKEVNTPELNAKSKRDKLEHALTVGAEAFAKAGKGVYQDVVFFCLVSACWQVRDENKNAHTSLLGIFCGWDKASKQAAVEEMKKILMHKPPYDDKANVDKFLDPDVYSARNEGILGMIFQLMCKRMKPELKDERVNNAGGKPVMVTK